MVTYRQPFKGTYPITQRYGEHIEGVTVGSAHTGIDYACPEGTPILASADGSVVQSGWDPSGYGNCVILLHKDGRSTLYAHLQKITTFAGAKLTQGEMLGLSGTTGKSTGPHLHFEARRQWWDYKSHFDPMALPLTSVDDSIVTPQPNPENSAETSQEPQPQTQQKPQLKGASDFKAGDLLRIRNPLGVKAFFDPAFSYDRVTSYQQGTPFYYTGDTAFRKDNGLTYMRVVPAQFSVWIAVNDGETQLLDKEQ